MRELNRKLLFILFITASEIATAGRPFITDDAAVVGKRQYQVETWVQVDKKTFQHWVVPTVGIGDSVEFSASGVHGITYLKDESRRYSYSGPIIQTKFLLMEPSEELIPGWAFALGTIPSTGKGYFVSPEWEHFFYVAGTSNLIKNGSLVIHYNLGRQTSRQYPKRSGALLWGIAIEKKVLEKTYLFTEASNGDIYSINPGTAAQVGFRHDLSQRLQFDGTIGSGIVGRPALPLWITMGIKYFNDLI